MEKSVVFSDNIDHYVTFGNWEFRLVDFVYKSCIGRTDICCFFIDYQSKNGKRVARLNA